VNRLRSCFLVHFFQRCVKRLLWKRELSRAEWRIWAMEREILDLRNQRDASMDCYLTNLEALSEANESINYWRNRYHQARKALRETSRGAQRNSMLVKLLVAARQGGAK